MICAIQQGGENKNFVLLHSFNIRRLSDEDAFETKI